jgi:hypothetical protein
MPEETTEPRKLLTNDLRAKRTAIVREARARVRKIDAAIETLEATDAEQVIHDAVDVLREA